MIAALAHCQRHTATEIPAPVRQAVPFRPGPPRKVCRAVTAPANVTADGGITRYKGSTPVYGILMDGIVTIGFSMLLSASSGSLEHYLNAIGRSIWPSTNARCKVIEP